MKLKKGIATGLVALVVGSGYAYAQTPAPRIEGEVNFAYVPRRTDDIPRTNEGKVSIRLDYLLPVRRSTFFGGIDITAYGPFGNPFFDGVRPNKFMGEAHIGYRVGGFEFYISHMSAHPFDTPPEEIVKYSVQDSVTNESRTYYGPSLPHGVTNYTYYIVNEFDYKTEIGIRIRFSGRINP